ncbi:MAG: hypothetical protein VCC04_02510, partial [Myxococcota bacterium]
MAITSEPIESPPRRLNLHQVSAQNLALGVVQGSQETVIFQQGSNCAPGRAQNGSAGPRNTRHLGTPRGLRPPIHVGEGLQEAEINRPGREPRS